MLGRILPLPLHRPGGGASERTSGARRARSGMIRSYLTVVGIILVVMLALGVWLKPPLAQMREGVEEGLSEYARAKLRPGETMPEVTHVSSQDWFIAVSHVAQVGDLTFYCVGAYKVTVCDYPK
jgi:hypothetical protein